MCWTSEKIPKKSQAIRDIPVYKVLTYNPITDHYISPIMDYVHEFGKKEESILDLPKSVFLPKTRQHDPTTVYYIHKGFHSYQKSSLRKKQKKLYSREIEIFVKNTDFSGYICADECYKNIRCNVLCSAHIPKGSFYYLNELGEYVSDTLIIDKVLDVNKELKELKKK